MKVSIIIYQILFSVLFSFQGFTQKYDHNWVLGGNYDKNGQFEFFKPLEFIFQDTGIMHVPFYNTLNMSDAGISISNKAGKLLFYTNGNHIESANNKRMENGDGLNEGSPFADNSPDNNDFYNNAYGYIVYPDSKDTNVFYLLHTFLDGGDSNFYFAPTRLLITKIDMSYNNGAGKVIYKNKILINIKSGPCLNITKHANGKDWWIMLKSPLGESYTQLLMRDDSLLSSKKFVLAPIALFDISDTLETLVSPVYFSPNGQIFIDIIGLKTVRVFDFDRCTGDLKLRDTINFAIDSIENGAYWAGAAGCTISPNSRYLYVINFMGAKQFDLLSSDIGSSRVKISGIIKLCDENYQPIPHQYFDSPYGQLGPDGKIYLFADFNHVVINNPDEKGLASNFCSLPSCLGIHKFLGGSPFYPNYRLGALKGSPCDTILKANNLKDYSKFNLKFYPNPSLAEVIVEIDLPNFDAAQLPILEVFDMLGRRVYKHEFPPFAYIHKIEAGTFPPGNYFSTLKVGGKIVKTNNLIISQ